MYLHTCFVALRGLPLRRAQTTTTTITTKRTPSRVTRTCPYALSLRPGAAAVAAAIALVFSPGTRLPLPATVSPPAVTLSAESMSRYMPCAGTHVSVKSIHDFNMHGVHRDTYDQNVQEDRVQSALHHDEHEFALSIRLVTAVVLGALIGMERRAPSLNLGIRSVTITSLSAALLTITSLVPAGGATTSAVLAAPPAPLVAAIGVMAAAIVLVLFKPSRNELPRRVFKVSAVVGLAATIGAACASGQTLCAAFAYLAALAVLRSADTTKHRPRARMTLRMATPDTATEDAKVVEIGGNSFDEVISNIRRLQHSVEDPRR